MYENLFICMIVGMRSCMCMCKHLVCGLNDTNAYIGYSVCTEYADQIKERSNCYMYINLTAI